MIGYINGRILEQNDGRLLVAVGPEGAAVGYALQVPQNASYIELIPGRVIELFVHTHVREDALELFGFGTRAEKELFLTFLSVNGIGPRSALGILSGAEPGRLIQAILRADKAFLTQVPGIGKKTAERVVLELSDPMRKKLEAGLFAGLVPASGAVSARGAAAALASSRAAQAASDEPEMMRDARAALVGLGYREQDATAILSRILAEAATPPQKVEELIRSALRQMM